MRRIAKVLLIFIVLLQVPDAIAGWTWPAKISNNGSYMPRLTYAGGVLHALYYDWTDEISYVRSTDLGQSWSNPLDMIPGWSCYPEIAASGDSIIAVWVGERDSWYNSNYVYRRSTNGGATWDDTAKVLASDRSDIGPCSFCISGRKVLFAFVNYDNASNLKFAKSTNFATSWNAPESLYSLYSIDNMEMRNFGDTLYLIFNGRVAIGTEYEVYFLKSTNAGQTWNVPTIISLEDSADSYYPKIAINEEGAPAVCWGTSGRSYHSDILVRLSHDFGQSWDPLIVNARIKGWVDKDISYSGDTLHLVSGGGSYIRHTFSTDNGITWAQVDTV
jgi:hypothetical protein